MNGETNNKTKGILTSVKDVEESRAQRLQRQQSRFRDRGGIFVPTNRSTLIDILLGRNLPSPKKRQRSASHSPQKAVSVASGKKKSLGSSKAAAKSAAPKDPRRNPLEKKSLAREIEYIEDGPVAGPPQSNKDRSSTKPSTSKTKPRAAKITTVNKPSGRDKGKAVDLEPKEQAAVDNGHNPDFLPNKPSTAPSRKKRTTKVAPSKKETGQDAPYEDGARRDQDVIDDTVISRPPPKGKRKQNPILGLINGPLSTSEEASRKRNDQQQTGWTRSKKTAVPQKSASDRNAVDTAGVRNSKAAVKLCVELLDDGREPASQRRGPKSIKGKMEDKRPVQPKDEFSSDEQPLAEKLGKRKHTVVEGGDEDSMRSTAASSDRSAAFVTCKRLMVVSKGAGAAAEHEIDTKHSKRKPQGSEKYSPSHPGKCDEVGEYTMRKKLPISNSQHSTNEHGGNLTPRDEDSKAKKDRKRKIVPNSTNAESARKKAKTTPFGEVHDELPVAKTKNKNKTKIAKGHKAEHSDKLLVKSKGQKENTSVMNSLETASNDLHHRIFGDLKGPRKSVMQRIQQPLPPIEDNDPDPIDFLS